MRGLTTTYEKHQFQSDRNYEHAVEEQGGTVDGTPDTAVPSTASDGAGNAPVAAQPFRPDPVDNPRGTGF